MKKTAPILITGILALTGYLSFWPVPIEPVSWNAPIAPGYTGGRVLGFDFDAAGNLIGADAMHGVLTVAPDRTINLLVNTVNGDPVRYANSVVADNGMIYFTDSSARFALSVWGGTFEASMLDIVEQSTTGRVLEYDPAQVKRVFWPKA